MKEDKLELSGCYEYKGNKYYIVTLGKMKHPVTHEWVDCVIYAQQGNIDIYVRERKEFEECFNRQTE